MAFEQDANRRDANVIVIDGVRLECRWVGPAPDVAPSIVMLHEGLGCVALWRDFPERLAEATGCGVFLYSRQGYGGSDPCPLPRPLDVMEREASEVLPQLLDAIGFRRGLLFGHSDGASIATIYAGSAGDHRVRGLMLMAPHFFVEEKSLERIARAREKFESGDLRSRLAKYHGENVDCAFRGWNDVWLDPAFRDWDILEHVAHIRVPLLIIQGENDEYGTNAQIEAAVEEAYSPVEVALIAGAGHAPHLDCAEETLGHMCCFIDRLMRDHREAEAFRQSA